MSETIFSDIIQVYQSATSNEDFLHKLHTLYEPKIFNYLKSKYMDHFKNWWKTYELPLVSSNKAIVLYETRCHSNLEFMIYNLTYFAKGWSLIIYCSKANYNFINEILDHNRFRAILHIVREDEGGREVRDEYNQFTKSWQFWNSLPCKNILMCEMDGYLRRHVPDDITDYDYVCCKWPWYNELPGGGGISFRNVDAMKRICSELPDLINEPALFAHDSWVAEGSKRLNLSFNNTYLVESTHEISDPLGFHNWWTFINVPKTYHKPVYDMFLTFDL